MNVVAMLAHDAGAASLLDREVADVADRMIGRRRAGGARRCKRSDPTASHACSVKAEWASSVLASRDDLGSVAAIKILRDAWLSPARRERFASEQRILAQLNHPAIARLYDADTLPDGTPWFAMEYVEGVPLTDYCRGASVRRPPIACGSSAPSARRCSTRTGTWWFIAISSRRTSWSRPTAA